jgi:hypothetical protein
MGRFDQPPALPGTQRAGPRLGRIAGQEGSRHAVVPGELVFVGEAPHKAQTDGGEAENGAESPRPALSVAGRAAVEIDNVQADPHHGRRLADIAQVEDPIEAQNPQEGEKQSPKALQVPQHRSAKSAKHAQENSQRYEDERKVQEPRKRPHTNRSRARLPTVSVPAPLSWRLRRGVLLRRCDWTSVPQGRKRCCLAAAIDAVPTHLGRGRLDPWRALLRGLRFQSHAGAIESQQVGDARIVIVAGFVDRRKGFCILLKGGLLTAAIGVQLEAELLLPLRFGGRHLGSVPFA